MTEVQTSKTFSDLSMDLVTGSRRKKRLSNRLQITLPSVKASVEDDTVTASMTVREAQALRRFLNENLG